VELRSTRDIVTRLELEAGPREGVAAVVSRSTGAFPDAYRRKEATTEVFVHPWADRTRNRAYFQDVTPAREADRAPDQRAPTRASAPRSGVSNPYRQGRQRRWAFESLSKARPQFKQRRWRMPSGHVLTEPGESRHFAWAGAPCPGTRGPPGRIGREHAGHSK
jgi:hypothetical protein